MSKLFVLPYVGEFGWELMNWQGHARWMSRFYEETVVSCRKGSSYLYEDFASEIIEIETPEGDTENNLCHGYTPARYNSDYIDVLDPLQVPFHLEEHGIPTIGNKKQEFIVFGDRDFQQEYDIILHMRNTNKCGTGGRDWSYENWTDLLNQIPGKRVACIGTKDQAMHLEGADDLRGVPLKELCEHLRTTNLIVGPSSGPMHLGSLCGTPQLVWSGHERNKFRYEHLWNPHNTAVTYLGDEGWQPSVDYVLENIKL